MRLKIFSFILLAAVLSGCATLAPDYQRPGAPVAADWPTGPAYLQPAEQAAQGPFATVSWQDFFVDQKLTEIIDLTLQNNRDLRIAALNIERARNLYQISRSELLPQVDGVAAGSAQRVPKDLSATGRGQIQHSYSVGLGISSYELDFFGRIRSLKDKALEQYLASEEARNSLQISLVAEVAGTYLTLAADRQRLILAQDTLENQQAAYQIVKSRFEAGIASALELYQAQTSVDAARVEIARYTSLVARGENALNLLVGATVDAACLPPMLMDTVPLLQEIEPGLPSQVLLQRPDILQAEHQLKAANANIGAARAAFFPQITLVSSLGTGSDELARLFGPGSLAWNFAPRLTLPIFTAGRNRANLKVAEADREIAVASYEKVIQAAFREVADALAQRGPIATQLAAQQSLTDATAESYRLSKARYEKGLESYLNVLVSQRAYYGAQQNLISTRLAKLTNLVTLYKALGGGR